MATLVRLIFLGSVIPSLHLRLVLWFSNDLVGRFVTIPYPLALRIEVQVGGGCPIPLSKRDSARSLLNSDFTREQHRIDSLATSHDLQICVGSGFSARE